MKLLMKLTLVVAAVAIGTGAALADDQHLQERLAVQQAQNSPKVTNVAVYTNHHGVGRAEATANEATANDAAHDGVRPSAHGTWTGN